MGETPTLRLKGDFMLTNLPDTYQFDECDDVLTSNPGVMGLAGESQRYNLLEWADQTLMTYESNRAYAPHEYVFTELANRFQGGVCLEDSRAISEDKGLLDWLDLKALPAPNTLGDWLDEARWKDVHRIRKKNRETVKRILKHRGILDLHVDIDAKVHESDRNSARRTYDGRRGDCPLYVTCPDEKLVWDPLFRPGNWAPKQNLASMVRTTVRCLPDTLHRIRVTMDAAAWQVDVISALKRANRESDQTIHYYIRPAKVSRCPSSRVKGAIQALSDDDWTPYGNDTDWEIADTTITVANPTQSEESRLVVVRKPVHSNRDQTSMIDEYRYDTLATNDGDSTAREAFEQYNQRGAGEDLIGELVEDGDAEGFPVQSLPGNGLLLGIHGLAHNLGQAMKDHALPNEWRSLTLKSCRRRLFGMACRIVNHARQLIVKFSRHHPWGNHLARFVEVCWSRRPRPAPT